jgi:hypothetical protein
MEVAPPSGSSIRFIESKHQKLAAMTPDGKPPPSCEA